MITWQTYRLKSKDAGVRKAAVVSIAQGGSTQGFAILKATLDDPDPGVVQEAVAGIAAYEDETVIETLREALRHINPEVRRAAAAALGKKRAKEAEQDLALLLRDPSSIVREASARALVRIGWRAADAEQQTEIEVLTGNARAAAIGGEAVIDSLVQGLQQDTVFIRRNVAEALEFVNDPRVLEPLLAAAADPEESVRISAIHALARMPDQPKATDALKQILRDANPKVRLAAAEILGSRAIAEHAPSMIPLLKDTNYEVRICAARFLGRLREPAMAPHLLAPLNDPDCDVRRTAVEALGACGSREAVPNLVLALADEDMAVRNAAATALNGIDTEWRKSDQVRSVAAQLESVLESRPAWVRAAVSQLLSPAPEGPLTLRMAAQ